MTLERLRTTLAALSLTAIDARLETLLESASKKEPAYADFLLEVDERGSGCTAAALSQDPVATGASAVREDIRSVRLCFSTLHRRAADSRAAHASLRARSIECHFAGAA
jgi:hypothetical protein